VLVSKGRIIVADAENSRILVSFPLTPMVKKIVRK
jgi:hypothetical protein